MEQVEQFHDKSKKFTEEEKKKRPIIKTPVDLQRLKVEKLMKNPDKPINIPEPSKEKDFMLSVPNFVRNVMGSSAGAGSGEFHVYRHLRRKEYARQKFIQSKSLREQLDDDYHNKLEKNRLEAEAKTAKKRAKRLKKKQKLKQSGGKKIKLQNKNETESNNDEDDNDDDDDEENDKSSSETESEKNTNINANDDSNSSLAFNKNVNDENTNSSCNIEDNCSAVASTVTEEQQQIEVIVPNRNDVVVTGNERNESNENEKNTVNEEGDNEDEE